MRIKEMDITIKTYFRLEKKKKGEKGHLVWQLQFSLEGGEHGKGYLYNKYSFQHNHSVSSFHSTKLFKATKSVLNSRNS